MSRPWVMIDGNEATARVAYRVNEVVAIYPITPASAMGEYADAWSAKGESNLWGAPPLVQELQSEGGAAGAVHGALQAGALTTTFTASQGLLLMLPNMFKIAGELTSTVFHIAARSIAGQALSIFGDHSDVMAARGTGWAQLFARNVQEAHDFALIAQAATLEGRVPFLHVMDGFRTSHEIAKIQPLADDDMRAILDEDAIARHRARKLTPDAPVMRGTAQNPDVFFQAREAANPYYDALPDVLEAVFQRFAARTGRAYRLFDYEGAADAERVLVVMGSGAETAAATARYLQQAGNEKVGVVTVRLYRPFSARHLLAALPTTTRSIAVLDRTKEPGSAGEPLFQDVVTAVSLAVSEGNAPFERLPRMIGGRYGLSSKEFTPAMVAAVFAELAKTDPKPRFSVGIHDDVTHLSLDVGEPLDIEAAGTRRAVFYGLGSDGTVGANKNSISIIGEGTDLFAQGYFVYDSKKSGARTVSHLRFGPEPLPYPYLIRDAHFLAVHQFGFFERTDVLTEAAHGATLLINSPFGPDETWAALPQEAQRTILERELDVWSIDAHHLAGELGLGNRINTLMQACFFHLSGVLPAEEAVERMKQAVRETYGKRGEVVVRRNFAAIDAALSHLHHLETAGRAVDGASRPAPVPAQAPSFVQDVTGPILAGLGDQLPVSAMPVDGTFPTSTARWEKRNLALEVPWWEPDLCIQCGKCVLVCPHAAIRAKVVTEKALEGAPEGFASVPAKFRELEGQRYTLQVAVEDCTGCTLCVEACPAKDKSHAARKAINMTPQRDVKEDGRAYWDFFLELPEIDRSAGLRFNTVRDVQLLEPMFEFSGACAGCGETPYLKLLTQLFGDHALVANATGCSSIYGGNLPTTPWSVGKSGRGPAWSNSLFEDNAEFGLGMRLTLDQQTTYARQLVEGRRSLLGDELADAILNADQSDAAGIEAQRARVAALKERVASRDGHVGELRDLLALADVLVKKSVWIVGGDGWAYDIGYGGLDHVLASGKNVNVLVLDTEVYSNTGGQASKATSLGAVAKFAAGGKRTPKKDLGMIAAQYGYVYVAQVAMGADDAHTVRAFLEAESYDGPSLIIAYSHCIAHGIDMAKGMEQQKLAAQSGYWPLFRFDPRRADRGENPFQLDSRAPRVSFRDYALNENRYRMLSRAEPEEAERLFDAAQDAVTERWQAYEKRAGKGVAAQAAPAGAPPATEPAKAAADEKGAAR